jgi:predicted dehydrogenase
VELAESKGLYFSMAPCSLLGETAQTLWRALRSDAIGTPRLVYAELDDGPFHLAEPHTWRTASGAPYEYREEYNVGVTVEHAEYYLGWLTAFFGPAKTITAFADCVWPTKPISPEETLQVTTPDFSVACVTFESGVVARLTCSLVAPFNHVMKIVGETGILSVNECWNFSAPVHLDRYSRLKFRAERYPITKSYPVIPRLLDLHSRTYPSVRKSSLKNRHHRFRMDYARGIAELAGAIGRKSRPRLPIDYCLHVTELSLAMQNAAPTPYQVKTTFKPLQPLDDAELKEVISPNW